MDIGDKKRALRHRMTGERDRLDPAERDLAAQAVAERVADLADYRRADTVLTYMSFGSELPTAELIRRIIADGKHLVLPRVDGDRLTLHRVNDPEADTAPGKWGIPEPVADRPVVPAANINLFLLPGLGFDAAGGRIGYGRGFFDRALADSDAIRVGIGYDGQLLPTVPMAAWDQRLHWVITPGGTRRCRQ